MLTGLGVLFMMECAERNLYTTHKAGRAAFGLSCVACFEQLASRIRKLRCHSARKSRVRHKSLMHSDFLQMPDVPAMQADSRYL